MFFPCTGVKKQVMVALCVYIGQLIPGYSLGWTAPVISMLKDPESSPLSDQISSFQKSFIGSIIYVGALASSFITGYLSNVKGRKPCLMLGAISCIVAYVIIARAETLLMICIGRTICGIGTGIINVTAIIYLGEIASSDIRGIFLTCSGISLTGGALLAFSVGPFVSYSMTAYVGVGIASVFGAAILWIPESPMFYALKDKEQSVRNVLEGLGRTDDLDKLLSPKQEEDSLRDWKELFLLKGNRSALAITVILNMLQHGSGTVAVTFFATSIFELAGSTLKPALSTIVLGATQLFGALLTPLFIEKSGRRILLLVSTAICSLSMLGLGVYFYLISIGHSAIPSLRWLAITLLVIFYLGYNSGFGIIPNAMAGEMFEPNVRGKGCAFTIAISYVTGFMITTTFGSLITVVGGHVLFWFFSAVCIFAFLYTVFLVPKTKGKSLKEIQEMLSK